ncbi:MAG: hypothetical protein WBD99_01625 [Thermodesulfobacteriota bacterium]
MDCSSVFAVTANISPEFERRAGKDFGCLDNTLQPYVARNALPVVQESAATDGARTERM